MRADDSNIKHEKDPVKVFEELQDFKNQLEKEKEESKKKDELLSESILKNKQMSTYLKQMTHTLSKERQAVVEQTQKERILWKLIERMNSSFELENILQATVDEIGYYFKVNRCGIIIPNHQQNLKELVREYADGEWKRTKEVYSQVSFSILYRTVTKTLKPLVINDSLSHELTSGHLNEELRSILMVPLLQNGNELVGVLYMHQCKKQRNWTESELEVVQSVANPLSTAVERAKLFNRTKSWASREKLLNRLTSRIRGTLNIKLILERTVAELGQALQVSRCFINIIDVKTSREIIAHEYSTTSTKPLGIGKQYPLIVNKLSDNELDYIAVNDLYRETRLIKLSSVEIDKLYGSGARAILAVPITFQDKHFGWLCFHQCNAPRNWSNEEIVFIQSAASQVGVAINQAEMFQEVSEYKSRVSRELKQAAELQSILLRGGADIKKNLKISVSYHPHHSVSGDFYWVNELAPHVVGILIGDVSGKGPAAALLTGYIIGEIKGLVENKDITWDPALFLTALGNSIYEQNQSSDFYATAWYGIFDLIEKKVICSNAGHPSPYIMKGNVVKILSDDPGVPLGLLSVNEGVGNYVKQEFNFETGSRMVIFTDGLTEQRKLDGSFISDKWLMEALSKHENYDLDKLPEYLIKELKNVSNAAPADDDRLVVAVEMPEVKTIEFKENDQHHVQENIDFIIQDVKNNGMPEMLIDGVKLGLIEAVYNALRYGVPRALNNSKKIATVSWWVSNGQFSCSIKDPGPGFDWRTAIKTKKEMDDVDILSEGGRGIPLYFEIFTQVKWNPAGNELGLTLKW